MKRVLIIVVSLLSTACNRTQHHEVTIKIEEPWRAGLSDEEAASIQKDKEICSRLTNQLIDEAGYSPDPNSMGHLALTRLKKYHTEYMNDVIAGNLRTAAPRFRKQIEGKTLQQLADEQRIEDATNR